MKLAEALSLRAVCQKRFEQLKARLGRNAKVQEGDQPAEDPRELLAESERVAAELADLVKHINRTNSATLFREGSPSPTCSPSVTCSPCGAPSTPNWRRSRA
jgi:hypothetical protein